MGELHAGQRAGTLAVEDEIPLPAAKPDVQQAGGRDADQREHGEIAIRVDVGSVERAGGIGGAEAELGDEVGDVGVDFGDGIEARGFTEGNGDLGADDEDSGIEFAGDLCADVAIAGTDGDGEVEVIDLDRLEVDLAGDVE